MQYKVLGNSGLRLPTIGQGCWGIGGFFTADTTQDDVFICMLQTGIDAGLTFLDTAENYGNGHSEELVGRAAQGQREKVIISTKVSPEHLSYDDILKSAEGSLRRLQTDYIDLYQVHWPNPRIPIAETMQAMTRLVREGAVRHIGVSNFSMRSLQATQAVLSEGRIQAVQVEYNLFDRSIENDLLPFCQQTAITAIAYTPLDKGLILSKDSRKDQLQAIASRYGKTAAQLTLKWLVSQTAVIAIPKATHLTHILENANAVDFDLSPFDYNEIDRLYHPACVMIPTDHIQADSEGLEQFVPGPQDLAETLRQGEPLKPIRVKPVKDPGSSYEYVLIEGKMRYWAWIIAHEGKAPIPALIRGDE